MMKKIAIIAPLIGALTLTCMLAREKSAFEAGDITQENPYGLTTNEKVLLKNTKQVDSLDKNMGNVKVQVGTLEEQMEGIRSVLDGTNARMNKIDQRLRSIETSVGGSDSNDSSFSMQLEKAFVYMNENRKTQEANNANIKKALTEISSLIDSINANYVPKSQFKKLEQRLAKLEGKKVTQTSTQKSKNTSIANISGQEAFQKAQKFFNKNSLSQSKQYFEYAVSKKYKPARGNYFLGEIAYKEKRWSEAITFYKKSVELYDKADYLPRLLYHTAISFDKIGDTSNANTFYQALKQSYPNSKEAKASPNR